MGASLWQFVEVLELFRRSTFLFIFIPMFGLFFRIVCGPTHRKRHVNFVMRDGSAQRNKQFNHLLSDGKFQYKFGNL